MRVPSESREQATPRTSAAWLVEQQHDQPRLGLKQASYVGDRPIGDVPLTTSDFGDLLNLATITAVNGKAR